MNAPSHLDQATVLVTGATGFIGSHLVDALLARGCTVHALVRATSNLRWLPSGRIHLHRGDLLSGGEWARCLSTVDHVFHCAGLTRARSRAEYFAANAEACERLFEACRKKGRRLRSVVHLSSLAAVGPAHPDSPVDETTPCRPITHYGRSKRAGEEIALRYSGTLPLVILRPPVVYGQREQNFFTYLKTLQRGWALQVGSARRMLSLIQVQDLVRAMIRAAGQPPGPEVVYFITDGQVYSWEEVAETAARLMGVRPKSLRIPEPVMALGAWVAEGLARIKNQPALLDRQRVREIRQSAWTASSRRFFETYDFQPEMTLERGLMVTLNWYREQGWL